ncbi:MAG: hypothetical protein GXY44_09945 [Phycisphaerales bacterium]|nr:hypothetical protein [Phycisphaerales bacterium]
MTGTPTIWIEQTVGRWKWRLTDEWAGILQATNCPDWLNLDNDARATLIKANPNRRVWRVQLNDRLIFAKISSPAHDWARWGRLLRGSDSTVELRCATYAAEHGIEAVQPIAAADSPWTDRRPVSILLTVGLANAISLDDLWTKLDLKARQTRSVKNQIIDAVARLIAQAHQNGFEHRDLHPGNILVEPLGNGDHRALFVDLHNIRLGRKIDDAGVIRNLALFNQWFEVWGQGTDRMRFLDRYLQFREAARPGSAYGHHLHSERRELIRRITRATEIHAHALYAKRDRRCLRSGLYFARLKLIGGWRAHVYLEAKHPVPGSRASEISLTSQQWHDWLKQPTALIDRHDARRVIKISSTAVICRTALPLPDGTGLEMVCKYTREVPGIKLVQNIFRSSRAMLTWRRAHALLQRQIPTARALAYAERRWLGLPRESLIVTEYIDNARDLDTVLSLDIRGLTIPQQRRLKSQLTDALVAVIKRLHARGFSHRDFKAPNVIVQWNGQPENVPRIFLVDLDGIRQHRCASEGTVLRAIMRLNVSLDHCRRLTRTDRLRFLRRYLERTGRCGKDWKPLWHELAALSEKKRSRRDQAQQIIAGRNR